MGLLGRRLDELELALMSIACVERCRGCGGPDPGTDGPVECEELDDGSLRPIDPAGACFCDECGLVVDQHRRALPTARPHLHGGHNTRIRLVPRRRGHRHLP